MIRPRDSIYVKIVNNRRWLYTMSATGSPANIGPRAIRVGFFVSGEDSKLLRFSRMRSGTRSVNRTDNLKFNAPRPKAQIDLAQSVHWFFNDYVDQWIGPKPPRLKRGDAVRILKGLLAHHVGLYHGMKPHERIEVLLSLLEGSQRVTLPESDV